MTLHLIALSMISLRKTKLYNNVYESKYKLYITQYAFSKTGLQNKE